jgi:hypothetical protein
MRTIAVRAIQGGWCVETDLNAYPLSFLSGAAAERQANRLAEVLARRGELHQVVIHDRKGVVIGSRVGLNHGAWYAVRTPWRS